jgi:hypothetical protein
MRMKVSVLGLWLLLLAPSEGWVQSRKPMTIAELVTYNAADWEQILYAGAKIEGKVVWYTSLAGDSYKGMTKAFETKYPGVRIEAYRVSGSEMTTRMIEESKAKRYIADTLETTEGNLLFLRDGFLLRPYYSPYFASYPEDAKQKGERGLYFWAIARESYIGFAYNKKLLSKNAVPKNYEGLLHPELKGRMGVSVSDPSYPAGSPRFDRFGRSSRLAGNLSQSHSECDCERRARRMGTHGRSPHQCRRRRHCRPATPSSCCAPSSGLSLGSGRSSSAGKIRIWQRG